MGENAGEPRFAPLRYRHPSILLTVSGPTAMTTPSRSSVSRRRFLQTTAAASALFAVPSIIPSRAFGANERVNLGFVGVKNRGMQNMEGFGIVGKNAGKLNTSAAAVCDVDSNVFATCVKRTEEAGHK